MIVFRLYGGLGNQMFQYAFAKRVGFEKNIKIKFDISHYNNKILTKNTAARQFALDIFETDLTLASKSDFGKVYFFPAYFFRYPKIYKILYSVNRRLNPKHIIQKSLNSYAFNWDRIPDNSYVDGYWINRHHSEGIKALLLDSFKMKYEVLENTKILLNQIETSVSICVHVRRTDYVGNNDYFNLRNSFFSDGVKLIESKLEKKDLNKIRIFVFSDDIEWCAKSLKFDYPVEYVSPEVNGEKDSNHFFLMRKCSHFVISNSTFSWWAAWLSEYEKKIVICPKKWHSSYENSDNMGFLIPEGWLQIEN